LGCGSFFEIEIFGGKHLKNNVSVKDNSLMLKEEQGM
jgi:hypothetical protein